MECPKAFIELDGRKMIDIILGKMRYVFSEVMIVTDEKKGFSSCDCVVVEDVVRGLGPLGGIYTGLKKISGEAGFFVACDMPYLNSQLISRIVSEIDLNGCECVVPRHSKGIEPLHAIYSVGILPKVEKALKNGNLSIREILIGCRCRYIEVVGDEKNSFMNINTQEDFERCRDLLSSR